MKIRLADGSGSIELKYLLEENRPGGPRIRFRRKGRKAITLNEAPGTPEFLDEYRAALNGVPYARRTAAAPTRPARHAKAAAGSLFEAVEGYYKSDAFRRMDDRTQYVRRGILTEICASPVVIDEPDLFGDQPLRSLKPKHVMFLRDRKSDTPEQANSWVKALRQVFKYGIAAELCDGNPAKDVDYIRTGSTGFHTWSIEEVRQFSERHPIGTKAYLAMGLLLYFGGRRADVVAFGRQHIRKPADVAPALRALHPGRWLRYTQHKNRKRKPITLEIPVLPALETILAGSPVGDLAFLLTAFGKPFTAAGFGNWFRDRCNEAELKHCSAHGLRKAGATVAAENGATPHQLMAIFGWRTLKQAEVYTKSAEQKRLAGGAMGLIDIAGRS